MLLSAFVAVAACKPAGLKHDAGRDAGLAIPDADDDLDVGSHPDFALTGERPVFGPEICDNGLDDDGDGFADCADSDCAAEERCMPKVEDCDNGTDDDGDGDAEREDANCSQDAHCMPEAVCNDGLDDDGDGNIDCDDGDCDAAASCNPESKCSAGKDDDD